MWWEIFPHEPRVQFRWARAPPTSISPHQQTSAPSRVQYARLSHFWEFGLFGDNVRFFFLSVSLYIVACTRLQKMTG